MQFLEMVVPIGGAKRLLTVMVAAELRPETRAGYGEKSLPWMSGGGPANTAWQTHQQLRSWGIHNIIFVPHHESPLLWRPETKKISDVNFALGNASTQVELQRLVEFTRGEDAQLFTLKHPLYNLQKVRWLFDYITGDTDVSTIQEVLDISGLDLQLPPELIREMVKLDKEYNPNWVNPALGLDKNPNSPEAQRLYFNPYSIELIRSIIFSLGTIHALKTLHEHGKLEDPPDIIFINDWAPALIAAYLAETFRHDPFFEHTKVILILHTLKHSGRFARENFWITGLGYNLFTPEGLEFHGKVSLLKAGLNFADFVVVRDRPYLEAALSAQEGYGYEGLINDLLNNQRIMALSQEKLSSWPPHPEKGLPPEILELWSEGLVGAARLFVPRHFKGMRHGRLGYPAQLPFAVLTREEKLAKANPVIAEMYRESRVKQDPSFFSRRDHDGLRRGLIEHGQYHVFEDVSPFDLAGIIEDSGRADWDNFEKIRAELKSFRPLDQEGTVSLVGRGSFTELPPVGSSAFYALVCAGSQSLRHGELVRMTLAEKHDSNFFDHIWLNRGLLPFGPGETLYHVSGRPIIQAEYKSLFELHARDLLGAQLHAEHAIPWYIMVSPFAHSLIRQRFLIDGYYGLNPKQVKFVPFSRQKEMPDHRRYVMVPALEEKEGEVRAAMHQISTTLGETPQKQRRMLLFPPGAAYLLEYLANTNLLSAFLESGKTHIYVSPVGNIGATISDPYFRAMLGYLKLGGSSQAPIPLAVEVAEPIRRGPLVVRKGNQVFACERYAFSEEFQKRADTHRLPVATRGLILDIKSLYDWLQGGLPNFRRWPRKKVAHHGTYYRMVESIMDLTHHFANATYFLVDADCRFISPRVPMDFPHAYRRYTEKLEREKVDLETTLEGSGPKKLGEYKK